jgi:hypothetical protein
MVCVNNGPASIEVEWQGTEWTIKKEFNRRPIDVAWIVYELKLHQHMRIRIKFLDLANNLYD